MNDVENIIRPRGQFLRSVKLERDFVDADALGSIVVTDAFVAEIARLCTALDRKSKDRAFRIIGDYGSGKSTFALLLANLWSCDFAKLPSQLQEQLEDQRHLFSDSPMMFPVLVTGSRQHLSGSIQKGIQWTIDAYELKGIPRALSALLGADQLEPDDALRLLGQFRKYLTTTQGGAGLLLVIDEAGKFLEHAAGSAEDTDVFLWQMLAEEASGSGKDPFVVVTVLHQGFAAYAHSLRMDQAREWQKVAGRFSEINFRPNLGQTARLIAAALNVDTAKIDKENQSQQIKLMKSVLKHGWYGNVDDATELAGLAPQLYPLNPWVVPVVDRFLRRYGQNERSVYGFMFGGEPFGLIREFQQTNKIYGIDNLYDYIASNYEHTLAMASDTNSWPMIRSLIAAASGVDPMHDQILKTIAVLNLVNADDLLPSIETIVSALADRASEKKVRDAISKLQSQEGKRVLYDRGVVGGLCLWSHVSVDMHSVYTAAEKAVGATVDSVAYIQDHLDRKSFVGRRHYIETGNLRSFSARFLSFEQLQEFSSKPEPVTGDGHLLVALCQSSSQIKKVRQLAVSLRERPDCVVVIPKLPISQLAVQIRESLIWEHILSNTPELNNDPYAQEAATLRSSQEKLKLSEAVENIMGLGRRSQLNNVTLYWRGDIEQKVSTGRDFMVLLSRVLDTVYCDAPTIRHELLNRNQLSSAAAGARMRLIEAMLANANQPFLGMDSSKRPPEMSMYLSLLLEGCLHTQSPDGWQIAFPTKRQDSLKLLPSLRAIDAMLKSKPDHKVSVDAIMEQLKSAPLGVRNGTAAVLLAVYIIVNQRTIAVYEEDRFLSEIAGPEFLRLTKRPDQFKFQYCSVDGVRKDVYIRLAEAIGVSTDPSKGLDLLDVVQPLCVFAAKLPEYVVKTKRLSPIATAVRDALMKAREPGPLLFQDLPLACGLAAISIDGKLSVGSTLDEFIGLMQGSINELRECYYQLRQRNLTAILSNFTDNTNGKMSRQEICSLADGLFSVVSEAKLKSFCFRLSDTSLNDEDWGDSVAALLANKPPRKWSEKDESTFNYELGLMSAHFRRAEATAFAGPKSKSDPKAMRICVTKPNGQEKFAVISGQNLKKTEARLFRKRLAAIVTEAGPGAFAEISSYLWDELEGQ